jgi:replicative superfamily II helicase
MVEESQLHELSLVVVDEVHFVGEEGRGAALELIISRLLHARDVLAAQTPSTAPRPLQIVGLTATLCDASLAEFARWMDARYCPCRTQSATSSTATTSAKTTRTDDDEVPKRPTPLREYVSHSNMVSACRVHCVIACAHLLCL